VAAEQAAEVLRQRERAQELALVTAQAARESAEGELAREKALAAERQAAHVAESSRLNAQLEAARQAKDAAVKAEGERVAAQMQAQVDRALVAQDDFRRRADAAVAESTKLREQLTAAQVELARAEAKTVRVKEIAQKFVEQAVSRAEQAEKELLKLTPGFALEGPLLDHLTVRASRLTERLVGMIERLGESTEQVVQFYRLGAALTPLEAAAALHAAADETLRRRGTSLEQEVSQSRQNVEGATG
jgi:hypothetical protein